MNRKILITVHYLIEADKDDFWDKDTGRLNEQVDITIKKRLPKKMKLTEKLHAQRYSLWHEPIDDPNANLMSCPICKRLITDMAKPNPIYRLDEAKELNGVLMCSSCAWEMEDEIRNGRSIESILEQFE